MALEKVTITVQEYRQLLKQELMLECILGAGVDNWQGYSFAMEEFREEWKKYEQH